MLQIVSWNKYMVLFITTHILKFPVRPPDPRYVIRCPRNVRIIVGPPPQTLHGFVVAVVITYQVCLQNETISS